MEYLRRFDRAWARAEGWLTVAVLLLMVMTAGFQALVRNLTRYDIEWANQLLTDMEWADSLLRKGTLWLAFLGASIATYHRKHIGIDILIRIAPPKAKYVMLAMSGIFAGIITLGLTFSFSAAIHLNLTERPIEYEMLGVNGSMHVCDATDAELAEIEDFDRPVVFCHMRSALALVAVPAETPGAAFQLIVPIMFFMIAIRLIAQGIGAAGTVLGGPAAIEAAEAAERERIRILNEAVMGKKPESDPPEKPDPDAEADSDVGEADKSSEGDES